jgi:arylsulfatase A-like enzyme
LKEIFYKMFLKFVVSILSLGIIGGFLTGLFQALPTIVANHYLQYRMFRTSAVLLQPHLNKWLLLPFFACGFITVLWLVFMLIRKYFSGCSGEVRVKAFENPATILISLVGGFFYCCIGWLVNHYWISFPRFHPLSLLCDAGLLIVTVILGMLAAKIKWNSVYQFFIKIYLVRIAFLLVLLAVFFNLSIALDDKINRSAKPNVLMIVIDSLRKDHMRSYGYERNTTPQIDRFSEKAIIFQRAVSQSSWTAPSVATLFSSLYPSTHKLVGLDHEQVRHRPLQHLLDLKITTLAEMLKEKGYATGGFVANHVWVSRNNQYDQGFDVFDPIDPTDFKPRAPRLNAKALDWITQNKSRPFFTYLHYMDVHEPYDPPAPYDTLFKSNTVLKVKSSEIAQLKSGHFFYETGNDDLNHYIDLYDGEISYVDHYIGRLLNQMQEDELLKNTIVIITSDHGESFFEHGYGSHGFTLYGQEIDIPLIIKFPESIAFPDIRKYPIGLIDIPAILLGVLNYSFPYDVSGCNSAKSSPSALMNRAVFSEELAETYKGPPKIAVIQNGYKAIYKPLEKKVTELYALSEDKAEMNNLIARQTEIALKLENEMHSVQKINVGKRNTLGLTNTVREIDDQDKIEQLKALGYLQ